MLFVAVFVSWTRKLKEFRCRLNDSHIVCNFVCSTKFTDLPLLHQYSTIYCCDPVRKRSFVYSTYRSTSCSFFIVFRCFFFSFVSLCQPPKFQNIVARVMYLLCVKSIFENKSLDQATPMFIVFAACFFCSSVDLMLVFMHSPHAFARYSANEHILKRNIQNNKYQVFRIDFNCTHIIACDECKLMNAIFHKLLRSRHHFGVEYLLRLNLQKTCNSLQLIVFNDNFIESIRLTFLIYQYL